MCMISEPPYLIIALNLFLFVGDNYVLNPSILYLYNLMIFVFVFRLDLISKVMSLVI